MVLITENEGWEGEPKRRVVIEMQLGRRVVVAIGGNAILRDGQRGTVEEQLANLSEACDSIASLVRPGAGLVLTHGNGPQVGSILIQNELAKDEVPPQPLDACVAQSQGFLGYIIQQSLRKALERRGLSREVVSIVTQVVVSPDDPAFRAPSKPIGPFYTEAQARRLAEEKGWRMMEVGRHRWRRVVPSPRPLEVVERETIRRLVKQGTIVVAAGGGGIPVVRRGGSLAGVEAVVDKDLASAVLARDIGSDTLLILTDVEGVALDFGRPGQRFVKRMTASDVRRHLHAGQFPPGSMGPKMEAALLFLSPRRETSLDSFLPSGAEPPKPQLRVVVASLRNASEAAQGDSGTLIVPD
ncbi:MAG: carbamate kinase [Thermoplasmata archaeon]